MWTVVSYHISADGTLSNVVMRESNGTPDQAQLAVDAVRNLVPLDPLPEHVKGIEVTELFWSTYQCPIPPGTLADKLRQMPDGRQIVIEY